MSVDLIERDSFLRGLDGLLREAAQGQGQTVLVSGEAGIGKTSLVEHFLARNQSSARALWGTCEALFTPRPLGPLCDIAQQAQLPLGAALAGEANRATLFSAVLDELAQGALPTVLVIEDIHWADEATLDLIKFLARRVHRLPALLLLTYRDDELARGHPLRLVLGDLPARDTTRLHLYPLSEAAVATLAEQAGRPADELYAITGGNPFFVTEVLASNDPGVPTSIRDAILTRVIRLSEQARSLLELVSVVPAKMEWWIFEAVSAADKSWAGWEAWLEECLAAGVIQVEDGAVGFRHELVRQAVGSTLLPMRTRTLNAQVLRALLDYSEAQVALARLVHHAAQAEDRTAVLRFAPAAARQAAARGAHHAAAAHYETALRYADGLDAEQHGYLLEAVAFEYYLTGFMEDAIRPRLAALDIWRALDRQEKVGHTLRQLSRLHWFLAEIAEAELYGVEAVELLETLPPGHELAMAYGNMSHLCLLRSDTEHTIRWGERAIELAERLGDTETVSYALNNIGSAALGSGDEAGWAKLERSLELALEHGYEEHVARAYSNLAEQEVMRRDHSTAMRYLHDGMVYCAERDLGSWEHCLRGAQARQRLDRGNWTGADEDATAILSARWASGTNRAPALIVLGQVRVRRGDPGVEEVLDEARDLALLTGDLERIESMATARAEWRWLQGKPEQCVAEAQVALHHARQYNNPWSLAEAAFWVWRGGGLVALPLGNTTPFAMQMAGDWRGAADAWERLGCLYHQGLALLDGDEAAQRHALAIFERLGARPAAELARRQLRTAGARGLPRGPRPTTQANPQGLTNRQMEILLLLAEGLRNSEIADRLSTTPKTAAHHVSDVLAKLQVRSRAEAVSMAHALGIVSHQRSTARATTATHR
jgi:DNA-binding CsgD family transcriptional regulator